MTQMVSKRPDVQERRLRLLRTLPLWFYEEVVAHHVAFRLGETMRGISGLSRLVREYVENRDGKLRWLPNLWLFLNNSGRAKRCMRGVVPWAAHSTPDGREYSLFRIRGVHCPHPDPGHCRYPRGDRTAGAGARPEASVGRDVPAVASAGAPASRESVTPAPNGVETAGVE